jgi:hypothetical protein
MSDSLSKAQRYHERADECLRLAGLATDDQIRQHYRKMAEDYLTLARAELRIVELAPRREPRR